MQEKSGKSEWKSLVSVGFSGFVDWAALMSGVFVQMDLSLLLEGTVSKSVG